MDVRRGVAASEERRDSSIGPGALNETVPREYSCMPTRDQRLCTILPVHGIRSNSRYGLTVTWGPSRSKNDSNKSERTSSLAVKLKESQFLLHSTSGINHFDPQLT